jgi:hypothetical protein
VLTTDMTTPVLLRLMRGTELEPYILRSGFVRRPPGDGPPGGQPREGRPMPGAAS